MRKSPWIAILALALLAAPALASDDHDHHPAAPADPRLDFLKSLAGRWIAEGEEMAGEFEFRVTAGGHAVSELEMIGTPMEMLTVYTLDGTDLVATHYCMIGNQPHAVASRLKDNSLHFECDGEPGNTRSHDEAHIHAWTLTLRDDGSIAYDAQMRTGDETEHYKNVLRRADVAAAR